MGTLENYRILEEIYLQTPCLHIHQKLLFQIFSNLKQVSHQALCCPSAQAVKSQPQAPSGTFNPHLIVWATQWQQVLFLKVTDMDTVRLRRAPIPLRCGFAMPSVFLTSTVRTGKCGKLFSRGVEGLAHLSSPFFAFLVARVLA